MLSAPDGSDNWHLEFSGVESDFLASIALGPDSLSSFADRFSSLYDRSSAIFNPTVSFPSSSKYYPALSLAHGVASNISIVARSLIEVENEVNEVGSSLQSDILDIFQSLSLGGQCSGNERLLGIQ